MRRFLWVIALATGVSGCSGVDRTPVVVYSPHGKEMLVEFERLYEASHPDQDVRWLDMGAQDAHDRIRTERPNPQADIWWGGPMTLFARAEAEQLLEPYRPTWHASVGEECRSSTNSWYGASVTPEVIMYNTRRVTPEEAPQEWADLLEPQWRGRIILRAPTASGTMRVMFSAIIAREIAEGRGEEAGFRWLRRLDANTRAYVADPTQLYLRIAREEAVVTIWNLPDVFIQVRTNKYPFGYVLPRDGTPLIIDCIALVKGSRHRAAAIAFYEFVTSLESMKRQAERFARIPARTDIAAGDLPGWMRDLRIRPMLLDWTLITAREQSWMQTWDEHIKGRGKAPAGG